MDIFLMMELAVVAITILGILAFLLPRRPPIIDPDKTADQSGAEQDGSGARQPRNPEDQ